MTLPPNKSALIALQLGVADLDIVGLMTAEDRKVYGRLPLNAKDELKRWFKYFGPHIRRGQKQKGITHTLGTIALLTGTSAPNVRRKWDAYWKMGWKGLVNRSLAGPAWQERTVAPLGISGRKAFLDYVRCLFENNQRGSKAAYKFELLPRWKKWRATEAPKYAIPGYDVPPPPAEGFDYPFGWSYENLLTYSGSRFELIAARIGREAAATERPLVYSTRAGLWVGSHYMMDDMWHDHFVNSFAEMQAGRPLELFTHDLFSARKVRWGVRVRVKGDDGKYKGLEERMARLVLAATLYLDGYSPRGTVIVIEHGTATVAAHVRTALHELSGGLISFSLSGLSGAAAHGGQYPGIVRGNFRHKASLESSNNLTHNAFAGLPGQTGKDVASRPEQLGALLKENDTLLKAYATLSPERAALLQFVLVELGQFHGLAHDIYRAIEDDPDHELNDWAECGHLVQQAWIDGQWRDVPPLDSLAEDVRAALLTAMDEGTLRTRLRKMTRREVWDKGAGELIRLPGHGVWEILQADLGAERRVTGNELAFFDQEVGPGKLRYVTRGVDAHRAPVDLRDRASYRVVVNPFAHGTAFAGDLQGRYIGEFPAVLKPTRGMQPDDPATLVAMGAAAHRTAELLTPLRERHAGEAAAKVSRQRRNAALMDQSKPATAEERAAAKQSQKMAAMAEEALERRASATATAEPTAVEPTATTRQEGTNPHANIITHAPREWELYDPYSD